eukprot:14531564-Ditylum_brightwellii.AAC.1
MKDQDTLFFYQLLFPMCDTLKSNVNGGPQKTSYTEGHSCDIIKAKIDNIMHFARYVQIKSIYKLNVNKDCPSCGEPGYDPCAKYDCLYRVLVDNMNSITGSASLDQCVDETLWTHVEFGSEVLHILVGKPVWDADNHKPAIIGTVCNQEILL